MGAQQTAGWNVFLQSSEWSIHTVVLGVGWRCNAEQLFISKPNKVYHRRRITFQQTLTSFAASQLVALSQLLGFTPLQTFKVQIFFDNSVRRCNRYSNLANNFSLHAVNPRCILLA